jgi:hypothetical protein
MALTDTVSAADKANIYEITPLTRQLQLNPFSPFVQANLAYQFRTESPSIARMQSERRIAIEYELLPSSATNPVLSLTYTGQEDPTLSSNFGFPLTGIVSQTQTSTQQLVQITASTIPGQVLTVQADFGTFTGVCTSLGLSATGTNALISIVRLTQVADIAKAVLP